MNNIIQEEGKGNIIGEENNCPRCGGKVTNELYNKLSGGWEEGDYIMATCVNCGELTFEEAEAITL